MALIAIYVLSSLKFARKAVRIAISVFRSLNLISGAVRITIHFCCDTH